MRILQPFCAGSGIARIFQKKANTMDKVAIFLFGLGFGAGAALLFAPRSGSEARGLLLKKADAGKGYLKQKRDNLRGSAADVVNMLDDAVEAGKKAYREKADHPHGQPA